jgi:hypothetical protein
VKDKTYLGDGLHVAINEHYEIVLTTENADGPTNTIILTDNTFDGLMMFFSKRLDLSHFSEGNHP